MFDIVSSLWNPTKGTISSRINPNIKGTFHVSADDQIFDNDIKKHYLQPKNQTFLISLDFSRLMDYFIKSTNTRLTKREKMFKGLSYIVHDYTVNESFYLIRKYIKFEIPSHIKPYFDKCKMVLITGHECILHSDFYDWDALFKKINLSPEKFILLSNDCRLGSKNNIPSVYNNALSRVIVPVDHKSLVESKIKKIKDKQINKWYGLCLNRIPKPHRILMANFFDTVLPDKINYSLGLRKNNKDSKQKQAKELVGFLRQIDAIYLHKLTNYNIKQINISKKIKPWLKKHKEKVADGEAEVDFSIDNKDNVMIESQYLDSCFNIVTESYFSLADQKTTFLTEKTFKPILAFQPFIIVGQPYSIQGLRDLGFDVFDDIINHNYDEEPWLVDRIKLVKNEVIRLCSIPLDKWSKILYDNFDRLYNNFYLLNSEYVFHDSSLYNIPIKTPKRKIYYKQTSHNI